MSSLAMDLSRVAGDAFAAEGLDRAFGQVQLSDRPDLAQFQCNGALAAAKAANVPVNEIGEVKAGGGVRFLADHGKALTFKRAAFSHF